MLRINILNAVESRLSGSVGSKSDPVNEKSGKLDKFKKRLWECFLGIYIFEIPLFHHFSFHAFDTKGQKKQFLDPLQKISKKKISRIFCFFRRRENTPDPWSIRLIGQSS